jgi:hypothetical protein
MKYRAEREIFVDIVPVPKEYATSLKSHECVGKSFSRMEAGVTTERRAPSHCLP